MKRNVEHTRLLCAVALGATLFAAGCPDAGRIETGQPPAGPDSFTGAGTKSLVPGTTLAGDIILERAGVSVGIDAVGFDPSFKLASSDSGITLQSTSAPSGGSIMDFSISELQNDQFIQRVTLVRGTNASNVTADPLGNIVLNYDAAVTNVGNTTTVTLKGVVTDFNVTAPSPTAVPPTTTASIGGCDTALAGASKSAIAGSATLQAIYGTKLAANVSSAVPILVYKGTLAPILIQTQYTISSGSRILTTVTAFKNLGALAGATVPVRFAGFIDFMGIGGAGHRSLDVLASAPMFVPAANFAGTALAGPLAATFPNFQSYQVTGLVGGTPLRNLAGLPNSIGGGSAQFVTLSGRDTPDVSYTEWDSTGALIVQRRDNNGAIIVQASSTTQVATVDTDGTIPTENLIAWNRFLAIGDRNDSASSADFAVKALKGSVDSAAPAASLPGSPAASILAVNSIRATSTIHGRVTGVPEGTLIAINELNPTALCYFDPGAQTATASTAYPSLPTFLGPTVPTGSAFFPTPAQAVFGDANLTGLFINTTSGLSARKISLGPVLRATVRPGKDGQFACTLPVGFTATLSGFNAINVTTSAFTATALLPGGASATVASVTVTRGQTDVDLGTVNLAATSNTGTLVFEIRDGTTGAGNALIPGTITVLLANGTTPPFDIGTPTGTEVESFDTSVSGNVIMSAKGSGSVPLRAAPYAFIASSGFEYEPDTTTAPFANVTTGTAFPFTFVLVRKVSTPDLVSGDFHVHSGQSFDSSLPAVDRVRSYVATGVEILGQTEHDKVGNLDAAVKAVKKERSDIATRLKVMKGTEATTDLSWIPGASGNQDIGHWNCFPMAESASLRKHGGIEDEFRPPSVLFLELRAQDGTSNNEIVLLAHPNTALGTISIDGTDGYLSALKSLGGGAFGAQSSSISNLGVLTMVDGTDALATAAPPLAPLAPILKGSSEFDAMEIMISGQDISRYIQNRNDWFVMLDKGLIKTSLADSDSHRVDDRFVTATANPAFAGFDASHVGIPRNYLSFTGGSPDAITDAQVVDALRSSFASAVTETTFALAPVAFIGNNMRAFATTGPLITRVVVAMGATRTANAVGAYLDAQATSTAVIEVDVEAPDFIMLHTTDFRLVHSASGTGAGVLSPTTTSVSGNKATVTFTISLPIPGSGLASTDDTWVVFECGQPFSALAADQGNLANPSAPSSATTYGKIWPRQHVVAWTNPIFLDRDGEPTKFSAVDRSNP